MEPKLPQRHHSALAQAERLISDAKGHIARQRELAAYLKSNGHDRRVAVSMLRALETSVRAFERHRECILRMEDEHVLRMEDAAHRDISPWRGRGFGDPAR
jgi:hypothetical protein